MSKIFTSIKGFDFVLLIVCIALIIFGIYFIHLAETSKIEKQGNFWTFKLQYQKQILFVLPGFIGFVIMFLINYQKISKYALTIYILCVLSLVLVLIIGDTKNNAKSWFGIWRFGIQPSEFCKLGMIIVLAKYLEKIHDNIKQLRYFLSAIAITIPVMILVAAEQELGFVIIFIPIIFCMLFMAGAKISHLLVSFGIGFTGLVAGIIAREEEGIIDLPTVKAFLSNENLVGVLILSFIILTTAFMFYLINRKFQKKIILYITLILITISTGLLFSRAVVKILKDYHVNRLVAFMKPEVDKTKQGIAYNIWQSKIAYGAGGFSGRKDTEDSNNKLDFVPEKVTDFISSVIAEEMGFQGMIIILVLYFIVIYRCIVIVYESRDLLGSLIGVGICSMFVFHILVNIGMCVGIMPVIGIPLPFLSAGGSSLITNLAALGLLINVYSRRYYY